MHDKVDMWLMILTKQLKNESLNKLRRKLKLEQKVSVCEIVLDLIVTTSVFIYM